METPEVRYKNPVFVVGLPRSGTTLMQAILTTLGGYFPIPETHFFSRASRGMSADDLTRDQLQRISEILQGKALVDVNANFFDGCTTKKDTFERLLAKFDPGEGASFLEKTPWHLFCHDEIVRLYPDARFVCLMREPRNHAASILNMNDDRKSMLLLARAYSKFAAEAKRLEGGPNFVIVTYEDLTTQTEEVVRMLAQFLKLEYKPEVLGNFHEAALAVGAKFGAAMESVVTKTTVARNEPEKWRATMRNSDGDLLLWLCRGAARALDYPYDIRVTNVIAALPREVTRLLSVKEWRRLLGLKQLSPS